MIAAGEKIIGYEGDFFHPTLGLTTRLRSHNIVRLADVKIVVWSMRQHFPLTNIIANRNIAGEDKQTCLRRGVAEAGRQRSGGFDAGRKGHMPRVLKGDALVQRAA